MRSDERKKQLMQTNFDRVVEVSLTKQMEAGPRMIKVCSVLAGRQPFYIDVDEATVLQEDLAELLETLQRDDIARAAEFSDNELSEEFNHFYGDCV